MAEFHKSWVTAASIASLVRFEDAIVKVNDVPNKGDEKKVPFKRAEFLIDSREDAAKLWDLAEADKGTVKDDDDNEVPADNPVAVLITYAYGLNCRAKVRAQFEAKFEDPEKADKQLAERLVKGGRFKSFDKALAAVKLMHEDDE